jgi:CelD/BcsL family acetyltransferase involved in cellulose biosynthesis
VSRALKTIIKRPDALTDVDFAAWTRLRAENPALISPYFHPDYTRTIAATREDVRVICAYENGQPIAFLPVQGERFARPVGAPMSDYHGIISAGNITYDDLLGATSIGALHFSSAVDTDSLRAPQVLGTYETAALDIGKSPEAWRESKDGSYRRHLKSTRRRIRKAEDDFGPRRFVYSSRDIDVFQSLIKWKTQKFAETGKYNVLSADWTMGLIRKLWEQPTKGGLRNDMHALYFGDRLAAIDLGLTDGHVFHSWIVAYDSDLHSYAPGIQLLEGLIDASPDLGYSRIDLGAGLDGYKRQYATHGQIVASGFVPISGPAGSLSRAYAAAERWGETALGDLPGKLRRRYSQIAACEDHLPGRAKAMLEAVITRRPAA